MKILFKECASSLIDLKLSAPFDLSFNLFLIILSFVFSIQENWRYLELNQLQIVQWLNNWTNFTLFNCWIEQASHGSVIITKQVYLNNHPRFLAGIIVIHGCTEYTSNCSMIEQLNKSIVQLLNWTSFTLFSNNHQTSFSEQPPSFPSSVPLSPDSQCSSSPA